MSLADATLEGASAPLLPRWSRAAMLGIILAAHALAFLKLSSTVPITPLPAIAIEFAPLPEPVEPPKAEPDTPPPQEMAPPPVEDVVPPPPPIPAPAPKPTPIKKVEPTKPRPTPQMRSEPRPIVAPRPAPVRAAAPVSAPAAPTMSTASYAALVAGELNRHKAYPESARAAGASGSVGVAFTIGPSGHATSIAVTSSSGNAALDSAARQAVASIRAPPPPGGVFHTSTTIRFSLR